MRVRGQVVRLIEGRDFGFLEVRDVAEDVFFHFQEVPRSVQSVQVGTWLEFEIVTRKGKPRARYITAPGSSLAKAARETAREEVTESLALTTKVVWCLGICEAAVMFFKAASGEKIWAIALAVFALLNGSAILMMYSDKIAAQRGDWRVPETQLLLISLLGGWPAAWFAMRRFKHKTSKSSFLKEYANFAIAHLVIFVIVVVFVTVVHGR